MLDSPEGVCPGQAPFEYPATSVLFSSLATSQAEPVGPDPQRTRLRPKVLGLLIVVHRHEGRPHSCPWVSKPTESDRPPQDIQVALRRGT
jgi:hypothetical protein